MLVFEGPQAASVGRGDGLSIETDIVKMFLNVQREKKGEGEREPEISARAPTSDRQGTVPTRGATGRAWRLAL